MRSASLFGAFNARWITPREVARVFVPIKEFHKLAQTRHSILIGPRGCGKTTLLKMLTREAQIAWAERKASESPGDTEDLPRPDFEAVYVPSDVRWSFELKAIAASIANNPGLAQRIQRVMIALAFQIEITGVLQSIVSFDPALEQSVALRLIDHWKFESIVPTFAQIRLRLQMEGAKLRSALASNRPELAEQIIDSLPAEFSAHILDWAIPTCALFLEMVPQDLHPPRWALCFDELEIAPEWLQSELLHALRSTNQQFLFKLTWSPVLPPSLSEEQQAQADYDAIRIWHSHILDAKAFCRELSTRLLRDRLKDSSVTPELVFGRSLFAAEERADEAQDVYARDSEIWTSMTELAKRDSSFRQFLIYKGFDPSNPVSDSTKARDECLRKIKPLVLLRETFKGAERARSRKRPALYAGEDAIYSMSDGNPRWLAGLLNELIDSVGDAALEILANGLAHSHQAPILSAASRRMMTYVRAYPVNTPIPPRLTLDNLIQHLGLFVRHEILGGEFNDEPAGSFIIDENLDSQVLGEIYRGLMMGALIYVGESPLDVPYSLQGARLRLSFMFSPRYRIAFRNYRAVLLSHALRRISDPRQQTLFDTSKANVEEDEEVDDDSF